MPVTPAEEQQYMVEVAKEDAAFFNEQLRDAVDHGYLFWTIQTPKERYQAYRDRTLQADFLPLMTEDYLALRGNVLQELQCVVEWNQLVEAKQQPQDFRRYFWAVWLLPIFPKWVFEHYQKDFIRLYKAELEREATA